MVARTPMNHVRGEKIAQMAPASARPHILLCKAKIPPMMAIMASTTSGKAKPHITAPGTPGVSRPKILEALPKYIPKPSQPIKCILPATILRIPPVIGFQVFTVANVFSFFAKLICDLQGPGPKPGWLPFACILTGMMEK